jgi:signal transduction histidine kinase
MISQRFRQLVAQQLDQFCDCQDLVGLGVYVAMPAAEGDLQLQLVQAWPSQDTRLQPAAEAAPLLLPQQSRRWLPLRQEAAVIGALRVDSSHGQWPETLSQRLHSAAQLLAQALLLDLEQQRWQGELQRERRQRDLLVHQMRNPLAALRTFTQLLLRRVETSDERRELVEHLLDEQKSLAAYLDALSSSEANLALPQSNGGEAPLLLPPVLSPEQLQLLSDCLEPLLARAAAMANLQGRCWHPPGQLPAVSVPAAIVGEILANLLENAFRYSDPGGDLGLWMTYESDELQLAVWDSGPLIDADERERIFRRGERGRHGAKLSGTGLGLALARDQAEASGGSLRLLAPASELAVGLPAGGNAFVLTLPLSPATAG